EQISAGDGLLKLRPKKNKTKSKTCSVGFIARSNKRYLHTRPIFYVINERNHCHENEENGADSFYSWQWNSNERINSANKKDLHLVENLGVVYLFGIQVTSSPQHTDALSYELIHDVTGYTYYDGRDSDD
ncbi:20074_t:CDS:2, partial [Racocetra fulgida]